jgi:hypothetical protein
MNKEKFSCHRNLEELKKIIVPILKKNDVDILECIENGKSRNL